MVERVGSFNAPQDKSLYVGENNLKEIAKVIDNDNSGFLENDELNIPDSLRAKIDTDKDGKVSVYEFVSGLKDDKISVTDFSKENSEKIANTLISDKVNANSLGTIGDLIDTNHNGTVSRTELAKALSSEKIKLSGNYLIGNDNITAIPDNAREYIDVIKSLIMKKDSYGNYISDSGTYTHAQANKILNDFIDNTVMPSTSITSADKVNLIKEQIMKRDSYGNYNNETGSLKHERANELIKKVLDTPPANYIPDGKNAKDYVILIKEQIMKKDSDGYYIKDSGTYKNDEAKKMINDFINQTAIPSNNINFSDKIEIIKSQIMKRDSYGDYNKDTGSITNNEADELIKKVFLNPVNPVFPDGNSAKIQIDLIKSLIMKRDSYGDYNRDSGTYTHNEADKMISDLIDNTVMPSNTVCNSDKVKMIKEQIMKKDSYGDYNKDSGTFTEKQANELINKIINTPPDNQIDGTGAKDYVLLIRSQIRNKDSYGNYDQDSGIYTPDQANKMINEFIGKTVMQSSVLSSADKIEIIKAQVMKKDSFGNYDKNTGSLTQKQANDLIKKLV